MGETGTCLIADAHLRPGPRPEQNRRLAALLEEWSGSGARLVLLGDTFHCWFERGGRSVGDYAEVLGLFARAAVAGAEIIHVSGNRDFAVGAARRGGFPGFFHPFRHVDSVLNDCGITPAGERYRFTQDGVAALCTHGDLYCRSDYGYRVLRWLTQGLPARAVMSWGPWAPADFVVRWLQMRDKKTQYFFPPTGISQAAAAADAAGARFVFCGHVHHGGRLPLLCGGREAELIVVPPWVVAGAYAVLQEGKISFRGY